MKDLLILLLLIGVTWGGYKGLVSLGNFSQSERTESHNEDKRLNQSAINEMKKGKVDRNINKEDKKVEKSDLVESSVEKTNGQKAMEAVRGTRLDIEGKPRSKGDFYTESIIDESAPYERENTSTADASDCLLYTSPSPRDATLSRMPSSA